MAPEQLGRDSADAVLKSLDGEARAKVQQALEKAIKQTEERNKARELDPDFLARRVTF